MIFFSVQKYITASMQQWLLDMQPIFILNSNTLVVATNAMLFTDRDLKLTLLELPVSSASA